MEKIEMAYVAEDPKQPGAAWAITADIPAMKDHNAKEIAGWIRAGATVRHVPSEEAKEMFLRWQRPNRVDQLVLAI